MTGFVLLAALLGLVAAGWLTRPVWRSPALAATLGVFVLLVAAVGYAQLGSMRGLEVAPGTVTAAAPAASVPTMEQIGEIVARALKDDPKNPRALALAGALAFDKGDYALAVRHWETLAQVAPPDSPLGQQVQENLAEARRRAGMPPDTAVAQASPAASAPVSPRTSPHAAQVSGTVRLAPALQARVGPDDAVFVFARAADSGGGPRMPLAVLRRQVKDLPMTFTLDDSLAMSPAAALSGVSRVVLVARISKRGGPTAQPGDLQGQSPPIDVGASGVAIEINEEVK
jgi:cytochrome c-type biogenesis protein CcmH